MILKGKEVKLIFSDTNLSNIFSYKNNKTLKETLTHKRYKKFNSIVLEKYPTFLEKNLGEFLIYLKEKNDSFYKNFLNPNGDKKYCKFRIEDRSSILKKGIYYYTFNEEVVYIGRCLDNYKKRINQGYGGISPKNCYIDGQSTNCHLNSLINLNHQKIKFYILPMEENKEIIELEKELISKLKPIWNIALK